ncbi:MAG: LuxR C-terminal-related transcriptional regulator [Chloroflexota bacterium]
MHRTSKPVVKADGQYFGLQGISPSVSIQVGSKPWFEWLAGHDGFVYEGTAGHFTARSELRRGIRYWYGHRRREGKLTKTYLGKAEELTLERLEKSSSILAGHLPVDQQTDNAGSQPPGSEMVSLTASSQALPDSTYISQTRYKPPTLPQRHISRPRLIQRIAAPVVLINAPSGFGKTTLTNEAWRTCGMPAAWVNLHPDDNHPQKFWATLVMALQTIFPKFGQGWILQPFFSSDPSLINKIPRLTNEIIRVIDEMGLPGICLVIEDYHHIQREEIHSAVQTWLEQIPPQFQLVLTSNAKFPFTLGNLRARGTVLEIKTDDLRFNLDEGLEFLRLHTIGQPLANNDMLALIKRTEGWAAGLVLAASILSQPESRPRITEIFTGAHMFLREFFMESVLNQQSEDVKTFLLRTSILDHLTGSKCNAVTGRTDSDEMLQHLWEESLFLERLERPGCYRYHEMFAEMLRNQLQEQFPAEITRLHRRAAKWYRLNSSPAAAIQHYLLSKSWEDAAAMIESVSLNELERVGEDARLLGWIQKLPEEVIQNHKNLLILYIRLARLVLPSQDVEAFLVRTEKRIAAIPVSEKSKTFQETLSEIRHFRSSWSADAPMLLGLHQNKEDEVLGQMLDGLLYSQRDSRLNIVKAETRVLEVYQAALAKKHLYSILVAGGTLANLAFSQGRLKRSEQIAQQVLQQANELTDRLPEPASLVLTVLSGVKFEWNQISQARQLLDQATALDPHPIRVDAAINVSILQAKIQSMLGDGEAALDTVENARGLNPRYPSNIWEDQDLAAYQALFRLHQGDLPSADKLLSTGWEIERYPFSAFVRASLLMEQNRNFAAEEILRRLLDHYPSSAYWMPMLRARVKLSFALLSQQKVNQARQTMAEAARIAAPEFFVRPFLSPGPQIPMLLSLVLHTEDITPGTRSFIQGTLASLGQMDEKQALTSHITAEQLAISASISPRELEILQAVSLGLSNQEIADKYSISTSTVKSHLENIFRKLDVSNRTQAIGKAHALRLFTILA